MSQPDALPGQTSCSTPESRRLIHDLRAPLVTAIGYLNELKIIRKDLLSQLSSKNDSLTLAKGADKFVAEIDEEIGLCIEMIGDSLEEPDEMMMGLRDKLR